MRVAKHRITLKPRGSSGRNGKVRTVRMPFRFRHVPPIRNDSNNG